MSRYFDLLQDVSAKPGRSGVEAGSTYEMRPIPDARLLAREELTRVAQVVYRMAQQSPGPKVIVFAGPETGTGCTSICAGVAEALAAQTEDEVCVVDANPWSPALHHCYAADNRLGFHGAMTSPGPVRTFAQQLPSGNLWLLPSGRLSPSFTGALNLSRLDARIGELRREFAYTLIDLPPVNVYANAIQVGQLSDGVVLVLGSNATRKETARRAKESFESAQIPVLGAILNRRTFPIPRFIYDRL